MKYFLLFGFLACTVACQPVTPPFGLTQGNPLAESTRTLPPFSTPRSASPTPKPTLPFTLTPLPRFFTEEFNANLNGWSILRSSGDTAPQTSAINGFLILEMTSPFTWIYTIYGAHEYVDVQVRARFENRAGNSASVGVVCRYRELNGWYEYNVFTDGVYNVLFGQWLAEGIADYAPMLSGESEYLKPNDAAKEIGMDCVGNTLFLYVDGKLIRKMDVTRYGLTEGKVGLAVSSLENSSANVAVDWVEVSEAPSP